MYILVCELSSNAISYFQFRYLQTNEILLRNAAPPPLTPTHACTCSSAFLLSPCISHLFSDSTTRDNYLFTKVRTIFTYEHLICFLKTSTGKKVFNIQFYTLNGFCEQLFLLISYNKC